MNASLKFLLSLLLVCGLSRPVLALELFGIELESAVLGELRTAIKDKGLVVVREAGEEEWFDVYDSSTVLAGSSRLYLGFARQEQRVAFLEYEFHGLRPTAILPQLTAKYGAPKVETGRYITDKNYRWQRDGIEIQLLNDWHRYKTRLIYSEPKSLAALLNERGRPGEAEAKVAAEVSLY